MDFSTDPTQVFQSTLPVRGATQKAELEAALGAISIHAPRAGSDKKRWGASRGLKISIHAPRAGSDIGMEEATHFSEISIHAPRAGSDARFRCFLLLCQNFNPRSPCGERPTRAIVLASILLFQSTLPVRGATSSPRKRLTYAMIFQSTLPVRGATMPSGSNSVPLPLFQSTLPVRGATMTLGKAISWKIFQSTLPVRGATI